MSLLQGTAELNLDTDDNAVTQYNSAVKYVRSVSYPHYIVHPSMAYPYHIYSMPRSHGNYHPGYATSDIVPTKHKEAKVQCPVCFKYLSRKSALEVHIRVHTGIKPFRCRYCNKAFSQAGNRTVHERIHRNERPYVCGLCYKSFIQKSALDFHIRTHERQVPVIVSSPMVFAQEEISQEL